MKLATITLTIIAIAGTSQAVQLGRGPYFVRAQLQQTQQVYAETNADHVFAQVETNFDSTEADDEDNVPDMSSEEKADSAVDDDYYGRCHSLRIVDHDDPSVKYTGRLASGLDTYFACCE
jgi:hypothetical protein